MRRLAFPIAFALLALLGACEKPDEASCRKAIDNMRHLMGTENLTDNNKLEGEVRRCKGGSSKKAVACAISATTYAELRACGFSKLPEKPPFPTEGTDGSGAAGSGAMGSGAGSAGSGAGSAAAGSGAAGSGAMGSGAAGGAGGSGSAGTGSAMTGTGSAAGSASGSAAGSATGSAAAGSAPGGSATK